MKINEKCNEVQMKIISGNLDSFSKSHLNECSDCAEFAKFAEQVKTVFSEELTSIKVPEQLDLSVKDSASRFLRKRNNFIIFIKSREFISFAVAAVLIIVSSIIFLVKFETSSQSQRQETENEIQVPKKISSEFQFSEDKKLNKEKFDIEEELFLISTNFMLCKEFIESSLNLDNIFLSKEESDYIQEDNLI